MTNSGFSQLYDQSQPIVDKITKHPTSLFADTFHRKKIYYQKKENHRTTKSNKIKYDRYSLFKNQTSNFRIRKTSVRVVATKNDSCFPGVRASSAARVWRRGERLSWRGVKLAAGGASGAGRTWARHVRARSALARSAPATAPAPAISVIRVHRRNTTYPISMDRLMIMDGKWWTIVGSCELQSFYHFCSLFYVGNFVEWSSVSRVS